MEMSDDPRQCCDSKSDRAYKDAGTGIMLCQDCMGKYIKYCPQCYVRMELAIEACGEQDWEMGINHQWDEWFLFCNNCSTPYYIDDCSLLDQDEVNSIDGDE